MMLLNKDCFDVLCDFTELDNIDVVLTDPPYLHNKGGGKTPETGKNSHIAKSGLFNFGSDMMKNMSSFTEGDIYVMLGEMKRFMTKMNCFFFCNDTLIPFYTSWANENRKKFTVLVWQKPLSILNKNRFSQNIEYIVRIYDNGTALNKIEQNEFYSKVHNDKPVVGKEKLHPTQKPVTLMEKFILLTTPQGGIVLDPFMGSGTTGVACKNLDRRFIGVELDEVYYGVAVKRIKEGATQTSLF